MKKSIKILNTFRQLIKREADYYLVKPDNILLFLTYRCTSRCTSCTMWKRQINGLELSLAEYKNFFDSIFDFGIKHVEMFGGDALLRKDILLPLIKYVKKTGIPSLDLPTNGNLMDEETAMQLVDSGVDVIYVSLDGVGDLHDKIRGVEGSFERARKGLEYLLKYRNGRGSPKIVVNCTVSKLNFSGIDKIYSLAQSIGADSVAYEYVGEFPLQSIKSSLIDGVNPQPYYIRQNSSLLLDARQAGELKEKIKNLKEKNKADGIKLTTQNIDILRIEIW